MARRAAPSGRPGPERAPGDVPVTPLLGGDIGRAAYKRRLRQERRADMADILPALTTGLAVVYTVLAMLVLAFADRTDVPYLVPLAAGSALVFYLVRLGVLESERGNRAALPIMLFVVLLTLAGAASALLLSGDPLRATALAIVALGAGFLVLDLAALVVVQAFVALSFAAAAWRHAPADGWLPAGGTVVFAVALAFVVNAVRSHGVRRLVQLRIADERHKTVLARSFMEVQESEKRFRMLSGAAFEGIIAVRGDKIRDINAAGAEIFGRSAAELIGTSVHALGRTDTGASLIEPIQAAQDEVTFPFHTVQGTVVDLEARSRRTRFQGEETLVVTVRDVTERRRHERERALLHRERTLILESVGDGILGLDRDGRATFANAAAADILGRPVEALVGQPHGLLLHEATGCPEDCPIRATLDGAGTRSVTAGAFVTPSGRRIPVDYTSAPISEGRATIGAVVVFRDISERLEVERLKDQFVSVVSHELKTPLTSMQGALRLVDAGRLGALPTQAARMVHIASENTDRLIRLVQDILDIERFRAGRVMLEPERVDAQAITQTAIETMTPMADARKVVLVADTRRVAFTGDADRVLQALTNLLSNAIKFSPEAGTVTLSVRVDGDHVRFSVRDDGPGIPEDQLDRVFERFHQVDASHARKFGGTGLGLAICRAIATAHGGTIHAESQLGQGSTFILRLPLAGPERRTTSDDDARQPRRKATT